MDRVIQGGVVVDEDIEVARRNRLLVGAISRGKALLECPPIPTGKIVWMCGDRQLHKVLVGDQIYTCDRWWSYHGTLGLLDIGDELCEALEASK